MSLMRPRASCLVPAVRQYSRIASRIVNAGSQQDETKKTHTIRRSCLGATSQPRRLSPRQILATARVLKSYSTSSSSEIYTASFAFFEAIWEAGITHCFVNLGSDHPSIIEAMVKGQREAKGNFPRIITCPNEVRSSLDE